MDTTGRAHRANARPLRWWIILTADVGRRRTDQAGYFAAELRGVPIIDTRQESSAHATTPDLFIQARHTVCS
jgi:hypothetical protein